MGLSYVCDGGVHPNSNPFLVAWLQTVKTLSNWGDSLRPSPNCCVILGKHLTSLSLSLFMLKTLSSLPGVRNLGAFVTINYGSPWEHTLRRDKVLQYFTER